jgi:hypothetical protein
MEKSEYYRDTRCRRLWTLASWAQRQGDRWVREATIRGKRRYHMLMALKMEKGAATQGHSWPLEARKGRRSLQAPVLLRLDFSPV